MDHLATVQVAIAALSDDQREREAALRITEELNRGIAAQCGLRLETYIWEIDVRSARRPGALPHEIETCDIAIAIFSVSLEAGSNGMNSEQEFQRAYASWKKSGKPHLLVYFSQKPNYSQKPLMTTSEDADAWERMRRFRTELPPDLLRWDYKSTAEFDQLVRKHLIEYIVSRSALPPLEESQTSTQSSGGASQPAATSAQERDTLPENMSPSGGRVSSPPLSTEFWARLRPAARKAIARAEGIRSVRKEKQVHIHYLIFGLFPAWTNFFARWNVTDATLRGIVREKFGERLPREYSVPALEELPPLSKSSREALLVAANTAEERGFREIWSSHLLYGALSVRDSKTVQALSELGIRREEIPDGDGEEGDASIVPSTREQKNVSRTDPETRRSSHATSPQVSDEELWARMGDSGRRVLERAAGLRSSAQETIHMEHLVAALFDDWRRFFERHELDATVLRQTIRRTVKTVLRMDSRPQNLSGIPLLSAHVRQALVAAAKLADNQSSHQIGSVHILRGTLSIGECQMVRALTDRGLNISDLRPEDASWAELDFEDQISRSRTRSEAVPQQAISPSDKLSHFRQQRPEVAQPVRTDAAPTPKVDSDLWSTKDCLGYEAYARTIASLITHPETKPPLTIGIKAPWGAGKTSLMKRVQHLLDGYAPLSEQGRVGILQQLLPPEVTLGDLLNELKSGSKPEGPDPVPAKNNPYNLPTRITVWFNAWKYQTSEQVWAGMAHCIISQVTARMEVKERELFWLRLHGRRVNVEEVRKRVYGVLLRKMVPTAAGVLAICAIAFWLAAVLPVDVSAWWRYGLRGASAIWGAYCVRSEWFSKLGEKAADTMSDLVREPAYEGKMGYLHLVESDMREVLQLATEKSVTKEKPNGDPLVVFVDDLDRCAPNKVAEVVEAINLFLCGDYPNCIFVLGMEPGMVAAALEVANKDVIEKAQRLGLVDRTAPIGWRFMEKIVQLPIVIPPPTDNDRLGYVNSLTGFAKGGGKGVPGATSPEPAVPAPAPITRPERHGKEEEAKVQSYIQLIGRTKSSAEAAEKAAAVGNDAPAEERWAALEAGNRVYEQALTAQDPAMAEFANRLSPLVEGNPRQIKRYVNVYRFYSTLRYRLGQGAEVPREDLPSAEVLARFVELSIRWPHAIDCLRVRVDNGNGAKVSLLKKLENESRKLASGGAKADEPWKKFVGSEGLALPEWMQDREFREFLSNGELLCETEGHGLW